MRGIRVRSASVAILVAVLAGAWPGPGGAASVYGPKWGRFTAAFPSAPVKSGNLLKQLTGVQGATAGFGYAVTKDKHLFSAKSSGPTVPTYEVVAVRFTSASVASSAIGGVRKQISHPIDVHVAGATGFKAFGSVPGTAKSKGHSATKGYTLGVEFLTRGSTGYQIVVAVRPASAAKAFIASVKPVG